jgi:hypothetical protein
MGMGDKVSIQLACSHCPPTFTKAANKNSTLYQVSNKWLSNALP